MSTCWTREFHSWSFQVRRGLQDHLSMESGEAETQKRRKAKYSQLAVAELWLPDTQATSFSSRRSTFSWTPASSATPTPLDLQGTDIKAYLQHRIPSQPWQAGPRHPEHAHPQCREHPSAIATPCGEVGRRSEATDVLILRGPVSQDIGEGSEIAWEHQPCRFQWVLVGWLEHGRR